jgi:CheY-like chemotaxis protein
MMSVLVVDDNPLNANLARIILARAGFDVRTVASASEALAAVDAARPEVVLTDISMPVTSGRELCAMLRDRYGASIRIVAYTAMAMMSEQQEILGWGFDSIVIKPAKAEDIVAAVSGTAAK